MIRGSVGNKGIYLHMCIYICKYTRICVSVYMCIYYIEVIQGLYSLLIFPDSLLTLTHMP